MTRTCFKCGGVMKGCLEHEESYTCTTCGHQEPIDKEHIREMQKLIIEKVFGKKPDKPENN